MRSKDETSYECIGWCLRQKRGIRITAPNENLCRAYVTKAKSALNMLSSAQEKDEIDWIATTAYYARYFAFYALLQKCGITSEIHDCSIALMEFLLVEEGLLPENVHAEFRRAKELREETQYYVTEEIDIGRLKRDAVRARDFVLTMEEVIEKIDDKKIARLREKLTRPLDPRKS